jgi:predicted transcriptional regulator
MPRQSVENKLERLERRVTEIEQLPARMDRLESQIAQLRTEMRDEFSAVRGEIRIGDVMIVTTLTEQIEESRRHTRVLFEEAVSRIASLQGQSGSTRPKKKR